MGATKSLASYLQLTLTLAATATTTTTANPTPLTWSPCPSNPSLDCTTLTVPLEYALPNKNHTAQIALARYNATAPRPHRKGSLLTNPGGPGSSGIDFLTAGAGSGLANITGGLYDIISWDPRGVGASVPLLQCFNNAGDEATASAAFPLAAEIEYSQFRNASYIPAYNAALRDYDSSMGELSQACAEHDSPALYTSSAAYVVRDMAAIVDALDGVDAPLNYWGFSYGTIYAAEFVQTFPGRVGRVVFDGVFDAQGNSGPYTEQLPSDEISVWDAIGDFVDFCGEAGRGGCALDNKPGRNATGSGSRTGNGTDLRTRIANIQASLYERPVAVSDGSFSITAGTFSFFMYSFLKLPTTWPTVATAVSELELHGNADPMGDLLTGATGAEALNSSAPDTASLAGWPLQCTDNAPSNETRLSDVASLILNVSLAERTPWLNADLSTLSFCRNFPNTRPLVPNLGAERFVANLTNAALTRLGTEVLIVNAEHDPTTPLTSAEKLQGWLGTSSQLVTRRGPGHTTISLASLGLVKAVREYFLEGVVPREREVHDVSQVVFSEEIGVDPGTLVPDPVFNGSYTEEEMRLLKATYEIFVAYISLP
ncbi:Alpha/Beta hydrolase protein [Aspergillus californicus]